MNLLQNQISPVVTLRKPPNPFPTFDVNWASHFYSSDKGNHIYILAREALVKYDLDQQIITEKYEYPTDYGDPYGALNPHTHLIYVIFTYCMWTVFDLKKKAWDVSYNYDDDDLMPTPIVNFKFIPSPINQLHCMQHNNHYRINDDINSDNRLFKLSSDIGLEQNHPSAGKSVYNEQQFQIMMFQEGVDYILMADLHGLLDEKQNECNWRKSKLKLKHVLPNRARNFEIILWNEILFVFNLEKKFIECIDLNHPQNGSFINHINEDFKFELVIKDNNANIHLLQLSETHDVKKNQSYHHKVSLFDLVPLNIMKVNQKDWETLVIGHCRNCEKNNKLPFIPYYLKQLILKFFPIFV